MSRVNYTIEQIKKLGLVQVNGGAYQSTKKLVDKNPKKLPNLLEQKNAKVKNATKVQADGLTFDSKLEHFMYGLLKGAGIAFKFQVEYELQPKFKFNGKVIRSIKTVIDFYLPIQNIYIDTKGWQTHDGKIKYKLFKYFLIKTGLERTPKIEMPKNQEECRLLLNKLLFDKK